MASKPIHIFTLPRVRKTGTSTDAGSEGENESRGPSIRDEIEQGLIGTEEPTVPGKRQEDRRWSFRRSVPTVVLYDEQGLRLYDRITALAPEYYPFPDELNLLKTHGHEIALAMGFPGRQTVSSQEQESGKQEQEQEDRKKKKEEQQKLEDEVHNAPSRRWRQGKWGDTEVGKWNNGVNGEQGQGGGAQRGYDVVELGAGALRKTAHLLTALSDALPTSNPALKAGSTAAPAPIAYHPLDLSHPELHRVLGEMNDAFGDKFAGKVECIGLHGDYEAGLQFIRDGKLGDLQTIDKRMLNNEAAIEESPELSPEENLKVGDNDRLNLDSDAISPAGSPHPSATGHVHAVSASGEASPMLSAITDLSSDMSKLDSQSPSASGTWSPIGETSTDEPNNASPTPALTQTRPQSSRPLHLVFLGSSLGNFARESAPGFLKSLPLRRGDTFLMGLDGRPPPGEEGKRKVEVAYNDPAGHTRAFEEHGWDVVRDEMGLNGDAGVEFVGRYNEELGRHEAYFRSKDKQSIHLPAKNSDVTLEKDELLNIEWSYKYSYLEALELFDAADLRVINTWKAPNSEYRLWLLERPEVRFTTSMSDMVQTGGALSKVRGVPQWAEWLALWKLWDHITLSMCPKEMLHSKPIDLRHICLFYLGHIPTFLDIHLTRLTKGSHTSPEFFKDIFERGIDPDVDDPTKIHAHSEVPVDEADWPSVDEVIGFRDRVRLRLRGIYEDLDSGKMAFTRHAGRVLFMVYEHEAMHAETLLYMLQQSRSTRAPSTGSIPQWSALAKRWNEEREENQNRVITLPGGEISIGHVDSEGDDEDFATEQGWEDHEFGWDNEHPKITTSVNSFRIDALPITNGEYMAFIQSTIASGSEAENPAIPSSWIKIDGETLVRTMYGPVSFDVAQHWPVMASKIELESFAKFKGGRLPTEGELRAFWESEQGPKVDGKGANIGFRNWHPVPPTLTKLDHSGRTLSGHNGGVWEWTSSEFAGLKGFEPSALYPGYSADFFDGKHYVVLGGSYATVPAIAGRRSFRNWYQGNYPYSFIGARVAYDA